MRNFVFVTVILIFAFILIPSVKAEPTITGPTGLIVNPTADITEADHVWIALNFFDNDSNSVWIANITTTVSEAFEVGVGGVKPDEGDEGLTFFVKWLFLRESENMPGAAAGLTVMDIAGINSTQYYIVASKFFYFGQNADENASLHGGLQFLTGDGDDELEFFGGVDIQLMNDLIAIAEFNSDDTSIFNGLTYGVRYFFGPQLTGQAGFIDGNLTIGGSFIF